MKRFFFFVLLLFFFSFSLPAVAKVIQVKGVSALSGPIETVRDHALKEAFRLAVEQAVGVAVGSDTLVENYTLLKDRVYTHASGYITHYDILSEGKALQEGTYFVELIATVSEKPLLDQLQSLGLLKQYRIWVSANKPTVQTILSRAFSEAGYQVVEDRSEGADFWVMGEGSTAHATSLSTSGYEGLQATFQSVRASLRVKVIRSDTKELLFSEQTHFTHADLTADAAAEKAFREAAHEIGNRLVVKLPEKHASWIQELQLVIAGLPYGDVVSFEKELEEMLLIRGIYLERFSEDRAEFFVTFQGDTKELAHLLEQMPHLKPFSFYVTSVTSGRVIARARSKIQSPQ